MAKVIENLKQANIGWQYYKNYYEADLDKTTLANRNETILQSGLQTGGFDFKLPNCQTVQLKTTYPGLLIGSGYIHEAVGDDETKTEAFKIGFFFDHVTGMPYIPGSSVKGVLRSAFPLHKNERYTKEKTDSIVGYLEKKGIEDKDWKRKLGNYLKEKNLPSIDDLLKNEKEKNEKTKCLFVEILGNIIFEGVEPYKEGEDKGKLLYRQIPIYKRDIFHDAYFSNAKKGLFLGTDYITPHKDPLKNPKPIKFLKILPEVKVTFRFDLQDNLLSKAEKEWLFRQILLDFGVGAKTNVGYGQFSEV